MSISASPRRTSLWFKRLSLVAAVVALLWLVASNAVAYQLTRRSQPRGVKTVPVLAWGADVPVLLLAGSGDSRAPVSDAAAICDRVPSQAKLVVIEGAGHLQLEQAQPTLYRESILELLESAARQQIGEMTCNLPILARKETSARNE